MVNSNRIYKLIFGEGTNPNSLIESLPYVHFIWLTIAKYGACQRKYENRFTNKNFRLGPSVPNWVPPGLIQECFFVIILSHLPNQSYLKKKYDYDIFHNTCVMPISISGHRLVQYNANIHYLHSKIWHAISSDKLFHMLQNLGFISKWVMFWLCCLTVRLIQWLKKLAVMQQDHLGTVNRAYFDITIQKVAY